MEMNPTVPVEPQATPQKSSMMKKILLGILIIVALVIVGLIILMKMSTVSVSPLTVQAGQSFTVSEHLYVSKSYGIPSNLVVTNQNNENVFMSDSTIFKKAGVTVGLTSTGFQNGTDPASRQAVTNAIEGQPGIIRTDMYSAFKNNAFYVEDNSCNSAGLGSGPLLPDFSSTDKQSYTILPSTPAGTYTITITKDFYCDGTGPTGTFDLIITK